MPDTPADRVLWQDQVSRPERPLVDLPSEADTVVIGGGYAGLTAATTLAAAGQQVVVLERDPLGTGAHTRNGGMVIPELKAGPATLAARYGPLGSRMYQEVHEAFDHVEALTAPGGIACDYARTGQLYLAHTDRVLPHLRHLAAEHHDEFGEDVRYVDRAGLADEIGSDAFPGGVVYERTGGLHPARFHRGLAVRADEAGILVADRTSARDLASTGAGHLVTTSRGAIRCCTVLITTNATADGLAPALARRVLPIGSFMVATEPLDPRVLDEITPRRRMFVDTKNLLFYWRATPDGRLAFGGRRSLARTTVPEAAEHLATSLRRIHPALADARITHRWGGEVAITLDRLPHVGRIEHGRAVRDDTTRVGAGGVWYATGCNGSGVALNTWMGHRLGLLVLGDAPPPAVASLRHRPIPAHRFRRAYLPVVGSWFRWQDRV